MFGVAENVVAGVFDAAITGTDFAVHAVVASFGEGFAFAGVVEGLDPLDVSFPSGIVVNADKDGVAIAVGDSGTLGEGDKVVSLANHDCAVAFALEIVLNAHRGIESEVLLVDLPAVASDVSASMSGINDDCFGVSEAQEAAQ